MPRSLEQTLRDAAAQWSANARLRRGVWMILCLLWVYGLLAAADWTELRRAELQALRDDIGALDPLSRAGPLWAAREREVNEAIARLRALSWSGSERGIIEATVQDWLRAATVRANLALREIRVLSDVGTTTQPTPAVQPGSRVVVGPRPPEAIRLRVVVEFRRQEAMAWLAELARHEPLFSVDRIVIRTQVQPPVMETELRVLGLDSRTQPP